ncbi:hypothetical protein [Dyadobacter sp. Leaf189]|uniref:hypothetical protein n=1 Tax=Dyadobacter sp. Leaf189 TaxID=1736295 RepID=UPI0006F22E53|nr:hypothetical protein [Dyadobacter sp. Leaf189]KQS33358.1 hypothetical protein ASG33_04555 [Dyadobacter sp. Leaf189]
MYTNDILWKSILEDTFEDFLVFFFPESHSLFDFSKGFEYLDKELEQLFPVDDCIGGVKFVDKLVKVFLLDGNEEWILVHVEVQGYADKTFAERMFTYYYRIWDNYRRRITAFAILTDENAAFLPERFEQDFLGTRLTFQFNAYKILEQSEEALLRNTNPFAQVILVVKSAMRGKTLEKEDLLSLKIALARRLLAMQIPKRKIGKLMKFLKLYVKLDKPYMEDKFNDEIYKITNTQKDAMGIDDVYEQLCIEQAVETQVVRVIRNMLRETSLDNSMIAKLVEAPVWFVEEVREREKYL